jgi:hypothetical protein
MILNAYAVLAVFLSALRILLALPVLFLGIRAYSRLRLTATAEGRLALEDQTYLLILLAIALLGLSLASWPLLYLLLQSYVPEWPGVMCIYGVTQVGKGSLGASRYLPGLVQALEVIKPALVFLSGAWFVLYWINRQTGTGPLLSRVVLGLVAFGALGVVDAAAEASYVLIPKKEESLAVGCCTQAFDEAGDSRFAPGSLSAEKDRPWVYAAFYGINGALGLGLLASLLKPGLVMRRSWLGLLLAAAVMAAPVGAVFLVDIVAPTVLHLPYHHCPYDLIPRAPEALVACALFVTGGFAVGWTCVACWFGNCEESRPFLGEWVRRILALGLFGCLGSCVMFSIELALA